MCNHEKKYMDPQTNQYWCPSCKCFPFATDSKEKKEWFKAVIDQEFRYFCKGFVNSSTPKSVRFEMLLRMKQIDNERLNSHRKEII
jgi:hypothetical protein